MQPFKNLKVVELAGVLAGPSVGMFFAELGAEVIKVENPNTGGDVTRSWKLPTEKEEAKYSAYFSSINGGNKQFKFIDIKSDKEELILLLKDADVFITNFTKGKADKLGLGYDYLKSINPKLIVANITGYGEESDKPAFDVVLQAESGYLSMTGHPDSPPAKLPVAFIDVLTAHQLKEAVLIALLKIKETGEGSYVSVSLYETAVSSLTNQATNYLVAKHVAKPIGSLHPNIAPYGECYTTKDRKSFVLAVGSNKQFAALCNCLSIKISEDERFATNVNRVSNRKALDELLANAINELESISLFQKFDEYNVPYGVIHTIDEVFQQPLAKGLVKTDNNGITYVTSIPFKIK